MKVGLLLNSNNTLCAYSEKYKELLIMQGIPFSLIDPNSSSLLDDLKSCSHLLFRHSQGDTDILIYEAIFNIAQKIYNIKCYPNFETYWSYENKVKEYLLLSSLGFPIIESRVFWDYTLVKEFLKETQYPFVVKLPKGAGSSNVVIVRSFKEGKKIIKQVFYEGVKSRGLNISSNLHSLSKLGFLKYVRNLLKLFLLNRKVLKNKVEYPEWQLQKDSILIQKYLPNNMFDTRVTIIGKRAFAFRRFVRKNDFRASGSGNINTDQEHIDLRCLEIAFHITQKCNFNTMAFDFIYDENNEPFINEISYCFVDSAVQKCPGYWDEKLNWHSGNFWPQKFQIEDFLGISF
jgi:glutathione synthase/RimK-type ligase-like ATP-grasp enzyme